MDRRKFIAASSLTVGATLTGSAAAQERRRRPQKDFYEQRIYHCKSAKQKKRLSDFLEKVAVPAMNRIGIDPVGVFSVLDKPEDHRIFMIMTHKSLRSFITCTKQLLADEKYTKDGAEFINLSSKDKGYERIESSLLLAFDDLPRIETKNKKKSRIFELRCYESHSAIKGQKKIDMFNGGGEIALFRKTGLAPVFFGEMLVGKNTPNLTYMIVFDDMEAHDKNWKKFVTHPEWDKMKKDPQYADTVSHIIKTFLKPMPYSQV